MRYDPEDTIAAVASPPGGAARGIVRLSGPNPLVALSALIDPATLDELRAMRRPRVVVCSLTATPPLPAFPAEVYLWPGKRSYTGAPLVELHVLGSPPLLEALVDRLLAAGARLAEPGEFTLRAFLAGRLDLTQAEAVLGVIEAADRKQLDRALAQLAGGLAEPLHRLRDALLELLAHLEAGLDFADEDLPFLSEKDLLIQLQQGRKSVALLQKQLDDRALVDSASRVVLVGWTNVGKSSLFNALAQRTGALVSASAGTTRDYVTTEIELGEALCRLVDTAGVDTAPRSKAPNSVDRASQLARARQSKAASLQLLCLDASRPLNSWEKGRLESADSSRLLVVWTKTDLASPPTTIAGALATSSVSGAGVDRLREVIRRRLASTDAPAADAMAATSARCRRLLVEAAASLDRAIGLAEGREGEELIAAELHAALDHLGEVVGAVYTDDVLDRIFSRFCVGK